MKSDMSDVQAIPAEIPRKQSKVRKWIGGTMLRALGWQVTGQFPAHKKMVVAVAPHTSNWDFFIALAVSFWLQLKISFLGKHSIFVPPIDKFLRGWGGIPVDRSKPHGVVREIASQIKQAENMLLCLAPEGTRKRVFPWKSGFLQIARAAGVPVLLVSLDYNKKEVHIGEAFYVGENIESELENVYTFFASVGARHPQNVGLPASNPHSESAEKSH